MNSFEKDPDATLDYSVDWTVYLGSSSIATSVWTVPTGLTEVSSSNDGKIAKVVISGGVVGTTYIVTNTITFVKDGETLTDDRSIRLFISDK